MVPVRVSDVIPMTYEKSAIGVLAQLLDAAALPEGPLRALRDEVDRLADRMGRAELHCAVVGQLKRGKSSLLNGLIGTAVLPTAVTPLTAISTYVRTGPGFLLRSEGEDGDEGITFAGVEGLATALAKRVTERGNPHNKRRLRRVEIELPAPVLQDGLTFIDTPGIGSTLAHNTEAAMATLPDCDIALFVISPDPPITAAELDYLKKIGDHAAEIVIVFNKIDTVDRADQAEIKAFVRDALTRAGFRGARIFSVSSRNRLSQGLSDGQGSDTSGFAPLTAYLSSVALERRARLVSDVTDLKAATLTREIDICLEQYLAALRLPGDVLKATLATFEASAAALSRETNALADQAAVSRNSILSALDDKVSTLKDGLHKDFTREIDRRLSAGEPEESIAAVLAQGVPAKFATHFQNFKQDSTELTNDNLRGHIEMAERFIRKARDVGRDLLHLSYEPPPTVLLITPNVQPYWVDAQRPTLSTGISGFYDQLLPSTVRLERIRGRLTAMMDELLTRNAEHLRWSIRLAVEESFRRFFSSWKDTLERAQSATRSAILAGLDRFRTVQADTAIEITSLEQLRDQIHDLVVPGAQQ